MMVDPRFIEADRIIADLQSQLEALKRSATQIEDLKTKLETTREQLEVATATLRTAQREADSERKVSDIWQDRAKAERTKREKAEAMARRFSEQTTDWYLASRALVDEAKAKREEVDREANETAAISASNEARAIEAELTAASLRRRLGKVRETLERLVGRGVTNTSNLIPAEVHDELEALLLPLPLSAECPHERRLGEALVALEELSEAAFWYGNSRSKRKPTNADRKKGDAIFAALDRARAVLRHGESAMAEGTEAETENPRREPGA